MSPHLSGWHTGSFGGNDSQFSEVLDTLQTTFPCPIGNIKSVKRKKYQFSSCFCVSCVTLLSERGSLVVKTTLTEHFFRWGFCEKFLSQGLSAALKTAIKLPSKHKFAQRGSERTKRISLFYIFKNIWSYRHEHNIDSNCINIFSSNRIFTFGIKHWPVTFGWLNKIKKAVRIARAEEEEQAATAKCSLNVKCLKLYQSTIIVKCDMCNHCNLIVSRWNMKEACNGSQLTLVSLCKDVKEVLSEENPPILPFHFLYLFQPR